MFLLARSPGAAPYWKGGCVALSLCSLSVCWLQPLEGGCKVLSLCSLPRSLPRHLSHMNRCGMT